MNANSERVAVVTGASGNLGLAAGRAFQANGYRVALLDRAPDRLPKLYPNAESLLLGGVDLGDAKAAASAIQQTLERFGRIDVLVNTVGAWRGGEPLQAAPLADWDFLFETNLKSTLHACRAAVPAMIEKRWGRIINVSSRNALQGSAGYAAYSAAKSAVIRLTESLADEVKKFDVTVNCILPGTIDTPQNRMAMPDADFSSWVEPAALADVVLFLASDAARAVTGAALPVFGRS